ncbi:hypothetical protein WJX72_007727 [[Myrmecia] bisecta]|uniref:Uncharacterized protein n=1 Tax=[Myrmecia] bisecta TaxID=41462 RepID=A0AAW1QSA3_9CHLO
MGIQISPQGYFWTPPSHLQRSARYRRESDAAASVASATSGPEAPGGAVDSSTPLEDADAQCQPVMGSPGPADLVLGAPLSISFDGLVLSADNFGNQESGAADPSQAQAVSTATPLVSRMPTPSRRPAIAPSPVSIGKGTLESWLEKVGIDSTFNTPARQDLQRLWGAAGEAKELRRLIQTVKESELDIAKTEAAEHQRHWDLMMEHSAHVEAENAQLRSELDEVQEALQQLGISNQAALEAAEMQKGLAEAEAERAKEAARQILELAMHANEDSAAREAEKAALVQELDTARLRLQEAEAARQAAHQVVGSSQSQIAAMDEELRGARLGMLAAEAAAHSAAQQAQANASEKLQIQAELMRSQEQLATALAASAAAGAAEDAAIAGLYAELKEAHEALYELHAERTHAEELAGLELRMQAEESQKLKAEVAALGEAQAADFLADQVFQAELQRAQQARQEAELERIKAMEEAGIIERMCQHENQLLRMGLQDAKERLAAAQAKAATADSEVQTAGLTPCKPCPCPSPAQQAARQTDRPAQVDSETAMTPVKAAAEPALVDSETTMTPVRATAERVSLAECQTEDDSDDSEPESADRMPMRMRRVGGRAPSEVEEREFRRRAAALRIRISPYFKRR